MEDSKMDGARVSGRRLAAVALSLALAAGGLGLAGFRARMRPPAPSTSIITYPAAAQVSDFDLMTGELAARERRGEHPKLVFGSSELAPNQAGPAHPARLFTNGRYAIDAAVMGRAGTADLWSAIEMGAMAPRVSDRRMVFFVSMQWFMAYRKPEKEFPAVFSEGAYRAFMENPDISDGLKARITDRMAEYGVDRRAGSTALGGIVQEVDGWAAGLAADLRRAAGSDPVDAPGAQSVPVRDASKALGADEQAAQPRTPSGDPDWATLFSRAEADARSRSAGNADGFYDSWYKKRYRRWEEGARSTWKAPRDGSYFSRQELDDFKMLLEVCREAGIEPLIVIQPVKGVAYDKTVYTAEVRERYYDMIRGAAREARVSVADFSDREYDPLFLRDYSHPSDLGGAWYARAIYSWFATGEAETARAF